MPKFGDMKWTLFPIRREELDFFMGRAQDFGHKACLEKMQVPQPMMEMPDLFCDECGEKLVDTRISVNDATWCSAPCASRGRGL